MNYLSPDELIVNTDLDSLLRPLATDELHYLRESMELEGWRDSDPAKIWGSVLLDGHNRLRIAKELGIERIPVVPLFFENVSACKVWMFREQIGRRNLTDSLRSLYVGQLISALKETVGTTQAIKTIVEETGVPERSAYRALDLSKSFDVAPNDLQEQFLSGELSASKLIEALRPIVAPEPVDTSLTKEEMAEKAKATFPKTVFQVAERTAIGIRNLRALCGDIEIVFKNQGVDLSKYAPEIATYWSKWQDIEDECERLCLMQYEDGQYTIPDELPEQ